MTRIGGNPALSTEHAYGLTLRVARWRAGAGGVPLLFLNGIGADIGAAAPLLAQIDGREVWTLDMPGVAREHVAIDVDGAVVRVKTTAEAPRQYQAAYELPEAIDADATSAKLENGVLTLTLAKKKPVVTARTIAVQ